MLLCSAKGEPREYNFSKWIQYSPDGLTKIKEYDSSRIEGGNAYLTFASVTYMDSGIYHCFVKNGIEDYRTGNATATNNTAQTVKGKRFSSTDTLSLSHRGPFRPLSNMATGSHF